MSGQFRTVDVGIQFVDNQGLHEPIECLLHMSNITVRPACESDWVFLSMVQETCMRKYAESTWGKWIPEPRENFRAETHQIIRCDGEEIGCIALIEESGTLLLEKLYILPSHQGRGVGTWLLRCIIERARTSRKSIQLRVLRVNPAQQFYERNGFKTDRSSDERHFMTYAVSSL